MDYTLRPMLCQSADEPPVGPEWVAEAKWDGWRIVVHVHDADRVQVFGGRNGNEYTDQLPFVQAELARMLPADSVVDGELVGLAWGDAQSAMTSSEPARAGAVKVVLFDVLRLAGHDVRSFEWLDRRSLLEQIFERASSDVVQINPVSDCSPEVHAAHLAAGFEGTVCKRRDSQYVNSRSHAWVKVKPRQTDEATIVGFKPSTRSGRAGAFVVEMVGSGVRTSVKCGTDARHVEAHTHPERWLGVVIEITHLGLGANGVPRSPNFLRRRDDRAARPTRKTTSTTTKEVRRMAPAVRRNYAAMGDDKLIKVIAELRTNGDAAQRAAAKGFDPGEDLSIATGIAQARGLAVSA